MKPHSPKIFESVAELLFDRMQECYSVWYVSDNQCPFEECKQLAKLLPQMSRTQIRKLGRCKRD